MVPSPGTPRAKAPRPWVEYPCMPAPSNAAWARRAPGDTQVHVPRETEPRAWFPRHFRASARAQRPWGGETVHSPATVRGQRPQRGPVSPVTGRGAGARGRGLTRDDSTDVKFRSRGRSPAGAAQRWSIGPRAPGGHQFDSRSGHVPGVRARSRQGCAGHCFYLPLPQDQ